MADGAEIETSPELYLDSTIRKYGVQGVMGRSLSYEEIIRMDLAAKVYSYYVEMAAAPNRASWWIANPGKAEILQDLIQLKEAMYG